MMMSRSCTSVMCFAFLVKLNTAQTTVPAPMVIDCAEEGGDFYESADDLIKGPGVENPCPFGLPGTWSTCPEACAAGMQVAVDTLDCCVLDYLNAFAGSGDHGMYPDTAFENVIPLCEIDINDTQGECFDQFKEDEPSEEEDCSKRGGDFYESANDLIKGPGVENPCPFGLPGTWSTCPEACAAGMQVAVDTLDCCVWDYLNAFAGSGDHGMYADTAFEKVIPLCEIDINDTQGECFDQFKEDEPSEEEDCFERARDFYGAADDLLRGPGVENPCPVGLPGVWTTCPEACASGLQVAVDNLDCCVREYLNEFAGPGADHGMYADRAFNNSLPLCEIDLSNTESECFDQFKADEVSEEEDCFESARDFFGSSDDLLRGSDVVEDPCPSPAMFPGNWEECPAACASGMQAAVDELGCCLREYLNEFAGPGEDHGMYANTAFWNVLGLCNLDIQSDSECFGNFVGGAAPASRYSSLVLLVPSLLTLYFSGSIPCATH